MKIVNRVFLLGAMILNGCDTRLEYNPTREYKSIEKALMSKILLAEDSTVITLEEGHFIFKNSLILNGKKHITIRGKGIDKTVLSFKLQ
ncbi:MAG: hypothetical protein AAFX57_05360, partial [Bacteroidota bacterium]